VGGAAGSAALAVLVAGAVVTGTVRWRPVNIVFVSDPTLRAMGAVIAEHVPPGGVVEAQPSFGAIRLTAGRSVVVDCKAVPYGGAPWRDYQARLNALGGRGACEHGGHPFLEVTAASLLATANRYGARYLVLRVNDPRLAAVEETGWRVLARPSRSADEVWVLAAPGAPDVAGG
jgi:hypothetical protein